MRILTAIFVLALITIAFDIYSDTSLVSEDLSHIAAPDVAAAAIVHGATHVLTLDQKDFVRYRRFGLTPILPSQV